MGVATATPLEVVQEVRRDTTDQVPVPAAIAAPPAWDLGAEADLAAVVAVVAAVAAVGGADE